MSFESFKNNFIDFLELKGRITFDKDVSENNNVKNSKYYEDEESVNIFDFTSELKEFTKQNPEFSEEIDISKLLEASIKNGEFDETQADEDEEFHFGLLNEFLAQDDVKGYLGLGENEEYTDEMLDAFLEVTNEFDGNEGFSIDDLFGAMEKVEEDDESYIEDIKETQEEIELGSEQETQAETASSSGGGGGSGGGEGGGGSGSSSNTNNSTDTTNNTSPLDGMTKEQLEDEKTKRTDELTTAQDAYSAVNSGENENIKKAQEDLTAQEEAWQSAIEAEEEFNNDFKEKMAKEESEIAASEQRISELNNKLGQNATAISQQQSLISSLESEITALNTSKSQLEAQISEANSTDGTTVNLDNSTTTPTNGSEVQNLAATTPAQTTPTVTTTTTASTTPNTTTPTTSATSTNSSVNLTDKLNDVTQSIENKQKELTSAKEKLTQYETEQKQIEADIQAENEAKAKLEEQRAQTEQSIMDNPEVAQETKNALKNYQTSRDTLATVKETELKTAATNLGNALNNVSEVEAKLSEIKANEIVKETKPKTNLDEMFMEHTNLAHEIVNDGKLKYLAVYPEGLDPNEEYPMMVYLHGSGERGANPERFLNRSALKNMQAGTNETFKGYMLFPISGNGWAGSTPYLDKYLKDTMADFYSKHKVDQNNVALVGYSEGGGCAAYYGTHWKDVFKKTAIISGITTSGVTKEDIQNANHIRGYAYSSGDGSISNYFGDKLNVVKGANHSTTPDRVFNDDDNGTGRSDLFEWLFGDEDSNPSANL